MHRFVGLTLATGLILATALPLAAQTVTATPTALNFQVKVGEPSPPAQTIAIESSPSGAVFSAIKDESILSAPWLTILPTNGVTPRGIVVSVDSSGFQNPGSRTVNIIVRLPESGASAIVPVTVEVSAASQQPIFSAVPPSVSFTVSAPGVTPQPKQILLDNSGGGILNYQVGVNYPASGPQGWLSVTPSQGTVSFNSQSHNVAVVSTSGLSEGTHTAQILFTGNATNSPFAVPVTLVVGSRPAITATPASLSFFASQDGSFPEIETISIQNEGGGPLQYEIAGDQSWLRVRPLRGDATSGPVLHEVVPDTRGLPQGVFLGNLVVTSATLDAPFLIPVRLTIGPPTSLFTLPSRLSFVGNVNIPVPARRIISLVNTPLAPGRWEASVVPQEATWLKISPTTGEIPGHIMVEVDMTGLGAATLEAAIQIRGREGSGGFLTDENGPGQSVAVTEVPVTLTALNSPPQLAATPPIIRLQGVSGASALLSQAMIVENLGGPQLNWESTVETDSGGSWLSISPNAGEAPETARISANTSNLAAGVYHGRITLKAGPQNVVVPVTLLLNPRDPALELSSNAVFWEIVEGGSQPLPAEIEVLNRGFGQGSWTVRTREISGPNWLSLSPSAGVSRPDGQGEPNSFTLAPNTTGLAPGEYEALIEVRSSSGPSPNLVTAALRVLPSSQSVRRLVDPGGLVFNATAGSSPQERNVEFRRNRPGATPFQVGASTSTGASWLTTSVSQGTTDDAGVARILAGVNTAGLTSGVRTGQISVTYGDGLVQSMAVTLIIPPSGPGACSATRLAVTPISPFLGFRGLAGRATPLEVVLHDDCGRLIENAAVIAAFESGDPAFPLDPLGAGRYGATWTPSNAATQNTVTFTAIAGSLLGRARVVGAIESSSLPSLSRYGVVNGASFAAGEAISPGGIVSVFGRSLAQTNLGAEQIPLPTTLGSTSLLIGGRPAPLYFSSLGQINAQAPYELSAAGMTQVVGKVGQRYTTPVTIPVASARPGVFQTPEATGLNRAIVQNQDGSLNNPSNPARRGDAIVVYLTGIGAVDPPATTGAASELARTTLPASATVGGVDAGIFYVGMAPGFVGLAQANLVLAPNTPIGAAVPLEIVVDGQPSNPLAVSIAAGR